MTKSLNGLWRRLAVFAPLLVLFAALGEVGLHAHSATRAPQFDDYEVLVDAVDELRLGAEPIIVAPAWAEPIVRKTLGDARMPLAHVAAPSAHVAPAVVEISLLGERSEAYAAWRVAEERRVADFVLRRLEDNAHRPVQFDFVDAIEIARDVEVFTRAGSARVPTPHTIVPRGQLESGSVPCQYTQTGRGAAGGLGGHPTFPRARFQCRGGAYFFAGVTVIADQDFRPRRCIWSHPPARGELVMRFHDVPLGTHLVGHAGIHWMTERVRRGAPVELMARVDGHEIGRWIHADGDGWARFEMPIDTATGGTRGRVELTVSAPDPQHRHFCFAARMIGPGVAP